MRRPLGGGRASRDAQFAIPRLRLGVGKTGAIEAFAILRGLDDVHGNLYLKRVAVARPGQGLGTAFLSLVLDEAFGPMGAERFHLDCFADNVRAQAVYRKLGMSRDGVLRRAYRLNDGTRTDLVMMAILKGEWKGRRQKYNMSMFVFSWNGPNLVSCGLDGAWRRVGIAWMRRSIAEGRGHIGHRDAV